jgi:hypothetical protein
MGALDVTLQAAVGAVFLMSSIGKLSRPGLFRRSLIGYEVLRPFPRLRKLIYRVLPPIELAVAALLLGRLVTGPLAAAVALPVLAGFTALIWTNARKGLRTACGCGAVDAVTGYAALVRNLVLMIMILVPAVNGSPVGPSIGDQVVLDGVAVLLAVVLLYLPRLLDEVSHQREHFW